MGPEILFLKKYISELDRASLRKTCDDTQALKALPPVVTGGWCRRSSGDRWSWNPRVPHADSAVEWRPSHVAST